jgi:hypothetical protein
MRCNSQDTFSTGTGSATETVKRYWLCRLSTGTTTGTTVNGTAKRGLLLIFHCTSICAVAHPALQSTHVYAHPALGSSHSHTHAHRALQSTHVHAGASSAGFSSAPNAVTEPRKSWASQPPRTSAKAATPFSTGVRFPLVHTVRHQGTSQVSDQRCCLLLVWEASRVRHRGPRRDTMGSNQSTEGSLMRTWHLSYSRTKATGLRTPA